MTVTLSLLPIDRSTLRLRIHSDKDDRKIAQDMARFEELTIALPQHSTAVH